MNSYIEQGDAFELLKDMEDDAAHLVLTDPPYDLDEKEKAWLLKQFKRVSSGQVMVFCPPENQWPKPVDQYLFWTKAISTKNTSLRYSRFVEMIFLYGEGVWNKDRHWSQYTNIFTDLVDTTNKHPYRKPPSLVERLILNHSLEGEIILDPFGGSMVVPEVCGKTGRRYIAFDLEVTS